DRARVRQAAADPAEAVRHRVATDRAAGQHEGARVDDPAAVPSGVVTDRAVDNGRGTVGCDAGTAVAGVVADRAPGESEAATDGILGATTGTEGGRAHGDSVVVHGAVGEDQGAGVGDATPGSEANRARRVVADGAVHQLERAAVVDAAAVTPVQAVGDTVTDD